MNIGEIKKNASGQLIGTVETLTMTRTIGLRPVSSSNARAPKYEIVALNDQRRWVAVGALFELASNTTGVIFYQGKIDDPSMSQPLYIAAFPREDGTMAIAWQLPWTFAAARHFPRCPTNCEICASRGVRCIRCFSMPTQTPWCADFPKRAEGTH